MGNEFRKIIAGVLERQGDVFVQETQMVEFTGGPVWVTCCRPSVAPPGPDVTRLAYDTLEYNSTEPVEVLRSLTPVMSSSDPNIFQYSPELFSAGGVLLFHLVLPPYYLPRLDTCRPHLRYAWSYGDRFVLGWKADWEIAPSFEFAEIDPSVFPSEAEALTKEFRQKGQAQRRHSERDDDDRLIDDEGREAAYSWRLQIFKLLAQRLTLEEIRDAVFWCEVDPNRLAQETPRQFLRELIIHLDKCRQGARLVNWVKAQRSDIDRDGPIPDYPQEP